MDRLPESPLTQFCLVRHGETEWNAARRMQGHIDVALNQMGLRQASAAGRSLKERSIAVLYSSDLQRAWKTAELIGESIGLSPRALPELRERCCGIFEGLTYDEAKQRHPEAYAAFDSRDPDFSIVTGESLRQMHARIIGKLLELEAMHRGQRILVVLHGGVLDIINRFVRRNPLETPRDFLSPNAGLNWISCTDGKWAIDAWGETQHLDDTSLDELPS